MEQRYSLSKEERLRGTKNIQKLFENGQSILQYPIRVVYLSLNEGNNVGPKVLFSVPKRRFKKAHDRNLLRRRMKEAFRQHKILLQGKAEASQKALFVAFTYIANEPVAFKQIENAMQALLLRLNQCVHVDNELSCE